MLLGLMKTGNLLTAAKDLSRMDPQTIGINMREWIEVKCKTYKIYIYTPLHHI